MYCRKMCNSPANININLVEQILEQGQKLRKAMVRSILKNDPFNTHILSSKYIHSNDEEPQKALNAYKSISTKRPLSCEDKQKFVAYLRGDHMSKLEERKVLQMFEDMSNTEIYELTERSYSSDNNCDCDTCKNYYKHSLSCDFNHSSTVLCKERREIPPLKLYNIDKYVCEGTDFNYQKSELENLKHIDSLKVFVHSLTLNQEGNKKVYGNGLDKEMKLPLSVNHTYFIEYHIPELLKQNSKSKSKVDSGLNSNNIVRLCSKKLHDEAVYFKQVSLHDIYIPDEVDVYNIKIKFQVSCRTLKQKNINVIGQSTFNFGMFLHSKYYTCNEDLALILNNDVPIVLGNLKVSLQLGCGQLYFGKELIDALNANKENIVTEIRTQNNEDNQKSNQSSKRRPAQSLIYLQPTKNDLDFKDATYDLTVRSGKQRPIDIRTKKNETPEVKVEKNIPVKESAKDIHQGVEISKKEKADEREVLFSFIYVSEACFFKETGSTYVTCQPFSRKDVLYSRLINCNSNPIYNFHSIIPLIYDDDLLNELRDNYMIFEFWEKLENQDLLLGICKIPLHQLYIAYRNPVIVKYLARNKLPVIICDWWEPVCDPLNGEVHGQSQLLVALGTNLQIHNLEAERGFKSEPVKAILYSHDEVTKSKRNENIKPPENPSGIHYKKSAKTNKVFKPKQRELKNSKDIGIQSNLEMDKSTEKQDQQGHCVQTDLLTALLTQLVQQNQKITFAESATNTENANTSSTLDLPQNSVHVTNPGNTSSNLRKTSDLLDSLQSALSVDVEKTDNVVSKDTFKAHVIIETALHLPSRKKCKSKKSRGRNFKQEEILPSTYVTFETLPGKKLEMTNIVQHSKNPEWDYGCDVLLPADILTNNQKRLIFKVWRKSNNSSLQPNLQTDTILGFAALDLTVLMAGLPIISGWFNIIDFSSKCNGQIKISLSPLENLDRFRTYKIMDSTHYDNSGTSFYHAVQKTELDKVEEPGELLNRALKRKFTELDEITQRLRLRLSHVTNDESDTSNDDFVEEFEKDINTLCIEDDYEMINFEDIAKESVTQGASSGLLQIQNNFSIGDSNDLAFNTKFSNCPVIDVISTVTQTDSVSSASSNLIDMKCTDTESVQSNISPVLCPNQIDNKINAINPLDKQLIEGRQKIDTLLEKLSLLTHNDAETFSSRYVSGCSVKNDANKIVENEVLNFSERKIDNIGSSSNENPLPLNLGNSSSSGSLSQSFDECRPTPDGSGNTLENKNIKKSILNTINFDV